MRLFIIRHADPDYPNKTITPAGHREAQALARRMQRMGLDRIYCSPLGRAIDTMRYTAQALEMSHTVEDWTQELGALGTHLEPWGRLMTWDLPGEIIRGNGSSPHPCLTDPVVETTFRQVQAHSDALLARHGYQRENGRYRIVQPNRQKIAVFCHGGLALTWLAHLLELPLPLVWSGFWLPPSSVTTVLFDERSATWAVPRVTGLGDVSHLYEAGLPVQPAGIKANAE